MKFYSTQILPARIYRKSNSIKSLFGLFTLLVMLHCTSSYAQEAVYETCIAQKGDGIYRLLHRNNLKEKKHFTEFIELNQGKLGPNNSLYAGVAYRLPNAVYIVNEPLYGTVHATIKTTSNKLQGAVFFLVSGHGGPDPGAIGKVAGHILSEDEYAYDVTLRLGRRLTEHGAKVHFIIQDKNDGIRETRYLENDKEERCLGKMEIPLNQNERLKQRANAVDFLDKKEATKSYRRCIVVHVDARNKHRNIDIFFYHHPKSKSGKQLATHMRNTVEEKYRINQPNRGYTGTVSPRRLYMITQTNPPVVYVELGNINHRRDQQRLMVPNNRQALANWMCEGIINDYETTK